MGFAAELPYPTLSGYTDSPTACATVFEDLLCPSELWCKLITVYAYSRRDGATLSFPLRTTFVTGNVVTSASTLRGEAMPTRGNAYGR